MPTQADGVYVQSYKLALKVIRLLRLLRNEIAARVLADHIMKSVTSIGALLLEASLVSTKREQALLREEAKRAAHMSKYWLSLLRDAGYLTAEQITPCIQEAEEIEKALGTKPKKVTSRSKKTSPPSKASLPPRKAENNK